MRAKDNWIECFPCIKVLLSSVESNEGVTSLYISPLIITTFHKEDQTSINRRHYGDSINRRWRYKGKTSFSTCIRIQNRVPTHPYGDLVAWHTNIPYWYQHFSPIQNASKIIW